MLRTIRGLPIVGLLLIGAACGGRGGGAPGGEVVGPRARANLITFEEIRQYRSFSNLYDLVASRRPRWLRPQGPDVFMGSAGQVQVHMDGNRLGDVDVLRTLAVSGVTSIQWIPPIDAGARFGLDHSHGAIIVSTRTVH